MAYQVDKFNGTFLTSVDDGTIDTTTDLRLVGKNYAGYGEVQNENFLHLLENFANITAPPKAIGGQVWYDTSERKLKFYDKPTPTSVGRWKVASGAEVSSTAPSGQLQTGEFWFDTSADQLRVWNGERYVVIGPEIPDDLSATAILPVIVKDVLDQNHPIVKISSGSDVIAIVSKDAFQLKSAVNPITGFDQIKKGINLVNTSGTTGITTSDHYFWGTASNSARLGGFPASDFIRFGEVNFSEEVSFQDAGFTLGDQNDFRIKVENGDEVVVENRLGNPIIFRIRVSDSDQRNVGILTATGIIPGIDNSYTLGGTTAKWSAVYATTFNGDLTGDVTGDIVGVHQGDLKSNSNNVAFDADTQTFYGTFGGPGVDAANFYGSLIGDVTGTATNALTLNSLSGEQGAVATSIAVRDASGNLTANRFIGLSDKSERLKIDAYTGVDGNPYRLATTTATAHTIVARDASSNISATLFVGTATAAQYADLAEKYLADAEYEPGTVVCVGGEKEVTATSWGKRAIGVVSTNPAFMMNKDLEGGTYIALKGRVPVKVVGAIKKGEDLIATDNGCAMMAVPHSSRVFAVALESSNDTGVKVIEALVL